MFSFFNLKTIKPSEISFIKSVKINKDNDPAIVCHHQWRVS